MDNGKYTVWPRSALSSVFSDRNGVCYADVHHMISTFKHTETFYADVKLDASCLKHVKGGN